MWTASNSISSPLVDPAAASEDRKEEELRPRASYAHLYEWPESDAQFLRSLSKKSSSSSHNNDNNNNDESSITESSKFKPNVPPEVVSQSSMRQTYLRSYKFTTLKGVGFSAGGAKRRAGLGVKVDEEKMKKKKKKGGFLNNLFGSRFAGTLLSE